jgi:L,D-peptidoglycan transpeptidase YkuD (ErfK/YbiS/YcfS/YnhG family)
MIPRLHDLVVTHWGARFMGRDLPVSIGRGGIAKKVGEGDGITPIGTFEIAGIGYRSDRVDFTAPNIFQRPIGLTDVWSDDPQDPDYNHSASHPDYPFSHEKLRRSDGMYDAFGILTYNWPDAQPNKGSAIFIHAWRKPRHRTEGCIAFDPFDLFWIFTNWKSSSRVIIRGYE